MSPIPMFYGIGVKPVTAQNQGELADQRVVMGFLGGRNFLWSRCCITVASIFIRLKRLWWWTLGEHMSGFHSLDESTRHVVTGIVITSLSLLIHRD
ncbi:hypothetical protein YC2023_061899 [Brassica napus]